MAKCNFFNLSAVFCAVLFIITSGEAWDATALVKSANVFTILNLRY